MSIFVLETGDEIKTVSGEDAEFHGDFVVGRLEITTIKGHKYGRFGQSGSISCVGHFEKSLDDLNLRVARGKFVAAIDFGFSMDNDHGLNDLELSDNSTNSENNLMRYEYEYENEYEYNDFGLVQYL